MAHTPAVGFRHNKSQDVCPPLSCSHNGKRPRPLDVGSQLEPGVRDPLRKTFLIELPQSVEVLAPEVSKLELHPAHCNRHNSPSTLSLRSAKPRGIRCLPAVKEQRIS